MCQYKISLIHTDILCCLIIYVYLTIFFKLIACMHWNTCFLSKAFSRLHLWLSWYRNIYISKIYFWIFVYDYTVPMVIAAQSYRRQATRNSIKQLTVQWYYKFSITVFWLLSPCCLHSLGLEKSSKNLVMHMNWTEFPSILTSPCVLAD